MSLDQATPTDQISAADVVSEVQKTLHPEKRNFVGAHLEDGQKVVIGGDGTLPRHVFTIDEVETLQEAVQHVMDHLILSLVQHGRKKGLEETIPHDGYLLSVSTIPIDHEYNIDDFTYDQQKEIRDLTLEGASEILEEGYISGQWTFDIEVLDGENAGSYGFTVYVDRVVQH